MLSTPRHTVNVPQRHNPVHQKTDRRRRRNSDSTPREPGEGNHDDGRSEKQIQAQLRAGQSVRQINPITDLGDRAEYATDCKERENRGHSRPLFAECHGDQRLSHSGADRESRCGDVPADQLRFGQVSPVDHRVVLNFGENRECDVGEWGVDLVERSHQQLVCAVVEPERG